MQSIKSSLKKILTKVKPRLKCQICAKPVDPEPVVVDDEKLYADVKIAICDSCGKKVKEAAEIDKAKKELDEKKRRLKQFDRYARIVGLPFTETTADAFSEADMAMVKEIFIGLKRMNNYVVVSDCGVGKSYYVSFVFANLLREMILSYQQLSYIRMRDVFLDIRRTYNGGDNSSEVAVIDRYRHKRFLAMEITDHQTVVGKVKSKFESDIMFDFVDLRYRNWKSLHPNTATVFISTVGIDSLSQVYDESVVSRIVEMSDRIFKISGTNRRYKGKDDKMKIIRNE